MASRGGGETDANHVPSLVTRVMCRRSGRGSCVVLIDLDIVTPRVERAPVPILRTGTGIDKIPQFSGTFPAAFAGVDDDRVLAESKPRFQYVLCRHAGYPTAFDGVTYIAPSKGVGVHQGVETAN